MVAHCRRHDNPDLVLDYEAQSQARRQKGPQRQHQPLLFDLGTSGSEEEDEEAAGDECRREARCQGFTGARAPKSTISNLEHVIQVRCVETLFNIVFHVVKFNVLHCASSFALVSLLQHFLSES